MSVRLDRSISLENVTLITIYKPNMHKQTLLFQPLKTTIQYTTYCDQRILIKFLALYCKMFVQMKHNSVHNEPVTHSVTQSDSSAKRCELSPAALAVPLSEVTASLNRHVLWFITQALVRVPASSNDSL